MTEQRTVTIRQPDEGELIDAAGDRYRFLAFASETDGTYGLWEATVPPGGGPPPHLHRREEEGFYVVSGEVTIHADGEAVVARPGAYVNMPKGSTHWNSMYHVLMSSTVAWHSVRHRQVLQMLQRL